MNKDITHHAANGLVYVEDKSGEIARHSVTEFYDAIPNSPDRGTAKIPNSFGDPVIRECAIVEWDDFDQCRDELITRREFIPIEEYINDYAEENDLLRAHINLISQLQNITA